MTRVSLRLAVALLMVLQPGLAWAGNVSAEIQDSNGRVGIGTTTPGMTLEVSGSDATARTRMSSGFFYAEFGLDYLAPSYGAGIFYLGTQQAHFTDGGLSLGAYSRIDPPANGLIAYGNIGIGTSAPQSKLHVIDGQVVSYNSFTIESTTPSMRFADSEPGQLPWTLFSDHKFHIASGDYTDRFSNTSGTPRLTIDQSGNVGIGTTSPAARLHVTGDAVVDGNLAAKYQDVAEWVRASTDVIPGTVVVVDHSHENAVRPSSQPYDTGVAGVVSDRPGLLLGESGDGKAKVAHSGRVKVKVDATYGSIAAGDLLVTSSTPGHAMRSEPVTVGGVPLHRPGTLLGKALEPLAAGQGEILVLVTLH